MLTQDVYERLNAALTQTVYSLAAPAGASVTYVVYRQVSQELIKVHDQAAASAPSRPAKARYQVSVVARTYQGALDMAAAVRDAMGQRSVTGSLWQARCVNETDELVEEPGQATQVRYVRHLDYMVMGIA